MIIIAAIGIALLVLIVFLIIKLVQLIKNKAEVSSIKRRMREKTAQQPGGAAPVSQPQYYADDAENEATVFVFGGSAASRQGQPGHGQAKVVKLVDASNRSKVYTAPAGDNLVIGHDADKSDICIDSDSAVSRMHCELSYRGSDLYIRDLNSTNGTFVNGSRIYGDAVRLSDGDMIRLGRVEFEIRF